ncbi:MAG: hypothetical protein JW956_10095 [Calditrichaceae bacterium]|nr:hypothetical protein [Calditrichaceae bacterium]
MNKAGVCILSLIIVFALLQCSGRKTINMEEPPSQTSVRINLANGTYQEGIIVTGDEKKLVYVNAESHRVDTLDSFNITSIVESEYDYDFYGNVIPKSEINQHKSYKNTFLYGAGGLVLGTAVGFGAFVAVLAADSNQVAAANLVMAGFGIAGAAVFGMMGHSSDVENAVEKAREARYKEEQKQMIEEKKKLEELKKQKDELKKKQGKQ